MKLIIFGSSGQVGKSLINALKKTEHEIIIISHDILDITNFTQTELFIKNNKPQIIINTAAYTAVDDAEIDYRTANLVNNLAVKNLSEISKKYDCWLIHISTDYVFDGNSNLRYQEKDTVNPSSVYGKTKLKGELAIINSECNFIILRTSWVFSEYGKNFLKTMLKLGEVKDQIDIISDQIGCPTYAKDIAIAIRTIISKIELTHIKPGLYHFCGDEVCSWYDFGKAIFKEAKYYGFSTPKILNPIHSIAFSQNAKRPAFSALDCSKIYHNFGIQPSNWREGIKKSIIAISIRN